MNLARNIISIDYEDWLTTSYYRSAVNSGNAHFYLEKPTHHLLALLDKYDTYATFFVLGSVAKNNPALIKLIASQGHEIASHGYSHMPIGALGPVGFKKELIESNYILEDLCQQKILGFRAPFFSLNQSNAWAIDILKEQGFKYDSSVFPLRTPIYGLSGAPKNPYFIDSSNLRIPSSDQSLLEFPISTFKLGPLNIPFAGGIYGRFLPSFLFTSLCTQFAKEKPLNLYLHPWEFGPQNGKYPAIGWFKKLLAHHNSDAYPQKIETILQRLSFTSYQSWINRYGSEISGS